MRDRVARLSSTRFARKVSLGRCCGFAAGCEARLCRAVKKFSLGLGYAHGSAFGQETAGQSPNRGRSPLPNLFERRGIAAPHIRRHSRSDSAKMTFRAKPVQPLGWRGKLKVEL